MNSAMYAGRPAPNRRQIGTPTPQGRPSLRPFRAGICLLALLGVPGCIDYTVETAVLPDGSGNRAVRVEVRDAEDNPELGLSRQEFREMLSVTDSKGWGYETRVKSGDTTHVFSREERVRALSDWSRLTGDVRIQGVKPSQTASTLGNLTLGEVAFQNQILVGLRRESEGSAAYTYMETYRWTKGVEAILEVMLSQMEWALTTRYPDLSDRMRGEILGVARARFGEAVEDGVFDNDAQWDDLWARAIRRTAEQGIPIVQQQYPSEEEDGFQETIDLFHGEMEEKLDSAFLQTLPGLHLALSSEITFTLTMPGTVTSTNAHAREGNVLSWEFSPGDALSAPVVLTAESEVGASLAAEPEVRGQSGAPEPSGLR